MVKLVEDFIDMMNKSDIMTTIKNMMKLALRTL